MKLSSDSLKMIGIYAVSALVSIAIFQAVL